LYKDYKPIVKLTLCLTPTKPVSDTKLKRTNTGIIYEVYSRGELCERHN